MICEAPFDWKNDIQMILKQWESHINWRFPLLQNHLPNTDFIDRQLAKFSNHNNYRLNQICDLMLASQESTRISGQDLKEVRIYTHNLFILKLIVLYIWLSILELGKLNKNLTFQSI